MAHTYQLFLGEWLKIAGNRWVTFFLMWIFPLAGLLISIGAILLALFSEDYQESQRVLGIAPWNENLLSTWPVVNNFIGRWVVLAFTAFVFAAEYKHGTYKNLITRQTRATVILSKFLTLAVFVVVSFTLLSLIVGIGAGIVANLLDIDYGLANFGSVFEDFMEEYLLQMFLTFSGTLIFASVAALAAMITRNVMASLIISVIVNFAELIGTVVFAGIVNWLFDINLYPFVVYMPSFSLENIASWIQFDTGLPAIFEDVVYTTPSLTGSLVAVIGWSIALVGLTIYVFHRQDIQT